MSIIINQRKKYQAEFHKMEGSSFANFCLNSLENTYFSSSKNKDNILNIQKPSLQINIIPCLAFYIIQKAMNKEVVIRVRSAEGQYRVNIMTRDTYTQLLLQLAKKLNISINDLIVAREDGKTLSLSQKTKIGDVPYFVDGAILKVSSRIPKKQLMHSGIKASDIQNTNVSSKCNHPPGGKCLNCISLSDEKQGKKVQKLQPEKSKCNHGPNGKCFNCTTVDLKDRVGAAKMLCQHGPNGKCVHCLDTQFISDTAHVSFDNWLEQKKLKCKGVHPAEVKCNNCLPPSRVRYEVDKSCKNHEPYPKAMCNKCIPPNVVIKRQEYRHVDYVQFMNIGQIQDFIRYWLPRKNEQQRVAFLYGYYAEDPHYKGGIRVIVEALYQPKQSGTFADFEILQNDENPCLNAVVTGLTLERVGWIFTDTNHDVVMSSKHVRMAAQFQQQHRVPHQSGYEVSNFITVILRPDEKNPNEVKPEVYMISDQGQALERSDLFIESSTRRKMQVRVKEQPTDAFPSFICGGKTVTQFQPEFLLVKIAHGSSKGKKFAIVKKAEFPPYVRDRPSKKDFKEYMRRNKNVKMSALRYGDFNFLLYLAHEIDPTTIHSIAECVANEQNVQSFMDEMIQHKSDL